MHGKDMRVLEACDCLDLALEALRAKRVGQLGVEHLECHSTAVPDVLREVDRSHSATAQLTPEYIAFAQHLGE